MSSRSLNVNFPADQDRDKFAANLPEHFVMPVEDDVLANRLLSEYGAVFVAKGGAVPPGFVLFPNAETTCRWQMCTGFSSATLEGISVELQFPALESLLRAAREAQEAGFNITPRGPDAARRTYQQTLELWESRVIPGLYHWVKKGGITEEDSKRLITLAPAEQAREILKLESQGLYFSKNFKKSILYSVAPPGASQHLSMLAFDLEGYHEPFLRALLAKHGWFQTVVSDAPHFTFLGVSEERLPALGLRRVYREEMSYWRPSTAMRKEA